MVEGETVRSLLETIERRLARLEGASRASLEDYLRDRDLQDIVERNFELAIQASIDLGLHLLADLSASLPDTNRGVFRELDRHGLIDTELAGKLEAMAGFRNVLAHEYVAVVPELVHEKLGRLGDVRELVRQLLPHLEKHGFGSRGAT